MDQVVQMAGAILILIGFVGAQRGRLDPQSLPYLVVNFVGSVLLCATALASRDWGFVLLEGVWAIVSLVGLVKYRGASGSPPRAST